MTLKEMILKEQEMGSSVLHSHIKKLGMDDGMMLIRARKRLLQMDPESGLVAIMAPQRQLCSKEDEKNQLKCAPVHYNEDSTVLFFAAEDVKNFVPYGIFTELEKENHQKAIEAQEKYYIPGQPSWQYEHFLTKLVKEEMESWPYDQIIPLIAGYHPRNVSFTVPNMSKFLGAQIGSPKGINSAFTGQFCNLILKEKARYTNAPVDRKEYSEQQMKWILQHMFLWNKYSAYKAKESLSKLLNEKSPSS